jgi:hypothetical protein
LAEVFTALANSQAHATALPPSSAGSLPSPLSLSPKSPPLEGQEVIVKDDDFTLEQFPFKLVCPILALLFSVSEVSLFS